jgi:hypothetical protein
VLADPGQPVLRVLLGLADDDVVVGRPDDRAEVGADFPAVRLQDLRLVREDVGLAVEVGVLRVLRGDAEGLLLAAAGDPQRDAAVLKRQRPADGTVDLIVLAVEGRGPRRP